MGFRENNFLKDDRYRTCGSMWERDGGRTFTYIEGELVVGAMGTYEYV